MPVFDPDEFFGTDTATVEPPVFDPDEFFGAVTGTAKPSGIEPIEEEERTLYTDYLTRAYPEAEERFADMSIERLRLSYNAERTWAAQEDARTDREALVKPDLIAEAAVMDALPPTPPEPEIPVPPPERPVEPSKADQPEVPIEALEPEMELLPLPPTIDELRRQIAEGKLTATEDLPKDDTPERPPRLTTLGETWFGHGFLSQFMPLGIGGHAEILRKYPADKFSEKAEQWTGALLGGIASYAMAYGVANQITKIPRYASWLTGIAAKSPRVATMIDAGIKSITAFGLREQVYTEPDTPIEERLKKAGESTVMALVFTGAGALGTLPKWGAILQPAARFAIGFAQGDTLEERTLAGATLVALNYIGKGSDVAKKQVRRVLSDANFNKAVAERVSSQVVTSPNLLRKIPEAKIDALWRTQWDPKISKMSSGRAIDVYNNARKIVGLPRQKPPTITADQFAEATKAKPKALLPAVKKPDVPVAVVKAEVPVKKPVEPKPVPAKPRAVLVTPETEAIKRELGVRAEPTGRDEGIEQTFTQQIQIGIADIKVIRRSSIVKRGLRTEQQVVDYLSGLGVTIKEAKPTEVPPVKKPVKVKVIPAKQKLQTMSWKNLQVEAEKAGITIGKGTPAAQRTAVVDELLLKQQEPAKDIILEEAPAALKRKRGFKNLAGAIGKEKQVKLHFAADSDAAKVEKMFDAADKQLEATFKKKITTIRDVIASGIKAQDAPVVRRLEAEGGHAVVMKKVAARGASGIALRDYEVAEKKIVANIPHRLEEILAKMIEVRRTIEVSDLMKTDRGRQKELFALDELPEKILNPSGLGGKEHRVWLTELKKQYPKEFPFLEKAAQTYSEEIGAKTVNKLFKEGLIAKELKDYLLKNHKNMSPRRFLQHIDPEQPQIREGRKISVPDSGIKALDMGSDQALIRDWRFLMGETLKRNESRIAKNKTSKALYAWAKDNPDNKLGVTIEPVVEYRQTPEGPQPVDQPVPRGQTRLSAMIGGKRHDMLMPNELAKYWVDSDPVLSQQAANVLKVFSGKQLVQALATGYNPEFAISNPPRDIALITLATREYSDVLPLAWEQVIQDLETVKSDVFKGTGRVDDYINEGGSMEFLSTQGQLGSPLERGGVQNESVRQIAKIAGWAGNKSELWTRLALRERAIINGKTPEEATYIARTYLDFAQGGTWVKAADNAMPYFNAAVQATRTVFRAFKTNPIRTSFKMAQLMTFAGGLAFWNRFINEDAWDSISKWEKITKFIITTPYYRTDKAGRKQHIYFAIPKDQFQQVFAAVAESIMEKAVTGRTPKGHVRDALLNMSPVDLGSLPPTVSAVLSYASNWDFWRDDKIWKGRTGVSPKEEYYATTPKTWVDIGKVTGVSPVRLQRATQKVFPKNPFTFFLGGMQKQYLPTDDAGFMAELLSQLSTYPMFRRMVRMTRTRDLSQTEIKNAERYNISLTREDDKQKPVEWVREEIDAAQTQRADSRHELDIQLYNHTAQIQAEEESINTLATWLNGLDTTEKNRLKRLLKRRWPKIYKEYIKGTY